MKKIIVKSLSILGFTLPVASCVVMYGSPLADYEVKGKVLDADGDPIKDIKVRLQDDRHYAYTSQDNECQSLDNGDYAVRLNSLPTDKLYLVVQDIDGAENGGEFEEKTVELDFSNIKYTGDDDAWYWGKKSLEQDVVLEEKIDGEQE